MAVPHLGHLTVFPNSFSVAVAFASHPGHLIWSFFKLVPKQILEVG